MDWLRQSSCKVGLIKGQKSITAQVVVSGRKPVTILSIDAPGKVSIYFGNLEATAVFADQALRDDVLRRVRAIPGIHVSSAPKYPSFSLDDLARNDTSTAFKAIVNDIVARLRADPT